jgi:hypothetical protein
MAVHRVSALARVLSTIPHLYALRVPALLALVLAGMPALAFFTDAKVMISGLYDLTPSAMLVLTLLTFTAAWTLLLTSWMILAYGPARLRCAPVFRVPSAPPVRWFAWSALVALPNIAAAILYSQRASMQSPARLVAWTTAGLVAAIALLLAIRGVSRALRGRLAGVAARFAAWLADNPSIGAGYVRRTPDGARFLRGHGVASVLALSATLLWGAIGAITFSGDIGYPEWVPTLAYVVLLILMLCAILPGITFFFDRYRVPVLVPIAAVPLLLSLYPGTDHFYALRDAEPIAVPSPAEALAAGGRDRAVVVAVNGGGIQAAAWAAQVLTGLEERCRRECGAPFADSVRLLSTVSGGTVGSMYFVNQYDPRAGFNKVADLASIRGAARASSLHAVGWGLLYWDLRRMYFPFGLGRYDDRGSALERAWMRGGQFAVPLSRWREGVAEGHRPAVIFNATSTDTGTRFLFSTTAVREKPGQSDFHSSYGGKDVFVSTAVRLSATFPYVSPAPRAHAGSIWDDEPHMGDGAYYDAYGISSLVEWLDTALEDGAAATVRSVLVIEIRGDRRPPAEENSGTPRDKDRATGESWRGWSYQLYAPLGAMLAVRKAGQIAHNEAELDLLIRRWALASPKVEIRRATFEYPETRTPLSWHLTRTEQNAIGTYWDEHVRNSRDWETVKEFLAAPARAARASRTK